MEDILAFKTELDYAINNLPIIEKLSASFLFQTIND